MRERLKEPNERVFISAWVLVGCLAISSCSVFNKEPKSQEEKRIDSRETEAEELFRQESGVLHVRVNEVGIDRDTITANLSAIEGEIVCVITYNRDQYFRASVETGSINFDDC